MNDEDKVVAKRAPKLAGEEKGIVARGLHVNSETWIICKVLADSPK